MQTALRSRKPIIVGSDSGVILPLLAIISFTLIVVFVVLGINARVVKYASIALRSRANDICWSVAGSLLPTARAADVFATSIDQFVANNPITRTTLIRARLIIPTMPDISIEPGFPFPTGFDASSQANDHNNFPPFIVANAGQDAGRDVCSLLGTCAANSFCSASPDHCIFQGDALPDASVYKFPPGGSGTFDTVDSRYPLTLWNNLWNAGNMASCELEAKVNTFLGFSGSKYISAKSVVWAPVTGKYYEPNSSPPPLNAPIFDGTVPSLDNPINPGLTIAVATEMTTTSDAYLSFNPSPNFYPSNFRDKYDLRSINPPITFQHPSPAQQYAEDFLSPVVDQTIALDALSNPDQEKMRAACSNPPALIRNIFVTSILELASRHGQLRNMTELLHINPQHRNVLNVNDYWRPVLGINYPSEIVRLGQDIALPIYQAPYVFYYGGVSSTNTSDLPEVVANIPAVFGQRIGTGDRLRDGFLNSFQSSGYSAQIQQHQALLASQLRICAHAYNPGNGIRRGHIDLPSSNFEPPTMPYQPDRPLRGQSYGSGQLWDTNCAYTRTGCSPDPTKFMTAAEVAGTLGTTQQCPFQQETGVDGPCVKPAPNGSLSTATYDLRPDLLGLLFYLKRDTSFGRSISAPGLFKLRLDPANAAPYGILDPLKLFDPAHGQYFESGTSPLANTLTSILIVLHQRLNAATSPQTGQSEAEAIRNLVGQINPTGDSQLRRPITIAYFPTTLEDALQESVSVLSLAFNAILGGPENTSQNLLLVFSPFDRQLYNCPSSPPEPPYDPIVGVDLSSCGGCPTGWPVTSSTITPTMQSGIGCIFEKYWKFLLTDDSGGVENSNSIKNAARSVFFKRLTHASLKF